MLLVTAAIPFQGSHHHQQRQTPGLQLAHCVLHLGVSVSKDLAKAAGEEGGLLWLIVSEKFQSTVARALSWYLWELLVVTVQMAQTGADRMNQKYKQMQPSKVYLSVPLSASTSKGSLAFKRVPQARDRVSILSTSLINLHSPAISLPHIHHLIMHCRGAHHCLSRHSFRSCVAKW